MRPLLLAQLRPARADLARLTAVSLIAAAPTFASGLVVSRALDDGFLTGHPWVGLRWLALLALLGVIGAYAASIQLPIMARIVEPLRDRLATLVVSHGLSRVVYDDTARDASGIVAVRATGQIEGVRSLIIALLRSAFGMAASVVLALAGLAALAPLVALATTPVLLVGLATYVVVVRRLIHRQRALLVAEERVGESARLVLTAYRDVAAFGATETAVRPTLSDVDASAEATRRTATLGWWRSLVPSAAIQAPVLAALALAPWLTVHTELSVGDLVGGVLYLSRGLAPAIGFLTSAGAGWLVQLGLLAERLATDVPPADTQNAAAPAAKPVRPHPTSDDLHLRATALTFAYSTRARPVIDGVDLDLPAGTHVVLVGPSGAGKSTLASLLVGVRTPQHGTATLAGLPLDAWPIPDLRRIIAYVPQESYVFAGTVRENLCYLVDPGTSAEPTDERITEAVGRFGLSSTVERLGGLNGEIAAGGDSLSAGERQLIALARVWLSPARVVVLDEATCHLDPPTEEAAEALLRARGGTLIIVAHRISSALRADLVGIVEGGRVHVGIHEHLIAANTRYAELVRYWNTARQLA